MVEAMRGAIKRYAETTPEHIFSLCMCKHHAGRGFMPICFIFISRFTNYDIQLLTVAGTGLTCFFLRKEFFVGENQSEQLRKLKQKIKLKRKII